MSIAIPSRAEATRAKLLEAALRVISRNGYERATVDAIAEAAGVSKGAFYGHFPSKEAAFSTLMQERCEQKRADLRRVVESDQAEGHSALAVGFAQGFAGVLEDPDWVRVFIEHARFAQVNADAARIHAAEYAAIADLIAELVERSRDRGLVQFEGDLRPLARVMIAVVDGFALQALIDPEAVQQQEVAARVAELFARALGVPEDAR
jgi:AcrR family transcriptional regulator